MEYSKTRFIKEKIGLIVARENNKKLTCNYNWNIYSFHLTFKPFVFSYTWLFFCAKKSSSPLQISYNSLLREFEQLSLQ